MIYNHIIVQIIEIYCIIFNFSLKNIYQYIVINIDPLDTDNVTIHISQYVTAKNIDIDKIAGNIVI